MAISKSLRLLHDSLLAGGARVVRVEGAECGHDHLQIWTQTAEQREDAIAMLHKVFSEDVEAPARPAQPDGGAESSEASR